MLLSFSVFADDHDSQESEWNVAEYYVSVFKDGKDMDDMMKWAEKWNNGQMRQMISKIIVQQCLFHIIIVENSLMISFGLV